jgi:hypothetical protein
MKATVEASGIRAVTEAVHITCIYRNETLIHSLAKSSLAVHGSRSEGVRRAIGTNATFFAISSF